MTWMCVSGRLDCVILELAEQLGPEHESSGSELFSRPLNREHACEDQKKLRLCSRGGFRLQSLLFLLPSKGF